jgi:5'-nucleotidase (lipoprotein e(P4) family)
MYQASCQSSYSNLIFSLHHSRHWWLTWQLAIVLVLLSSGCKSLQRPPTTPPPLSQAQARDRLIAVTWFKRAEAAAAYVQGFNLARSRMEILLTNPVPKKAIVTDIDETILDNSEYEAALIDKNSHYESSTWMAWTAQARAPATPGSVDFFQWVWSNRVEVFYISKREPSEITGTLANLRKLGFPNVDEQHVKLVGGNGIKEETVRALQSDHYAICLLLGDNLSDFSGKYAHPEGLSRRASVIEDSQLFGTRNIIFPNPMYGDWEKAP